MAHLPKVVLKMYEMNSRISLPCCSQSLRFPCKMGCKRANIAQSAGFASAALLPGSRIDGREAGAIDQDVPDLRRDLKYILEWPGFFTVDNIDSNHEFDSRGVGRLKNTFKRRFISLYAGGQRNPV